MNAAEIAEVLAEHKIIPSWQSGKHANGWSIAHCEGCDWVGTPSQQTGVPDSEQGRAHVADQIARLAVVEQDGGLRERVEALAERWQAYARQNERGGHFPWATWQRRANDLLAALDHTDADS